MTFTEAEAYCADPRNHRGRSMRLPTARELADLWTSFGARVSVPPARLRRISLRSTPRDRELRASIEAMFGPDAQIIYRIADDHYAVSFLYEGPALDLASALGPPFSAYRVESGVWTSTPTRPDRTTVFVFSVFPPKRFWTDHVGSDGEQPAPRYAVLCHPK